MDFINIIGTFFDNSIEHVVALANQIKDLRLNKNQQDINEDVYNEIDGLKEEDEAIKQDIALLKEEDQKIYTRITFIEEDLESVHQEFENFNTEIDNRFQEAHQKMDSKFEEIDNDLNSIHTEFEDVHNNLDRLSDVSSQGVHEINENIDSINEHIENIDRDNEDLNRRVSYIEETGLLEFKEGLKHRLVSRQEYAALESYDRNTLYVIVDFNENTSVFGDTFPLILGGDVPDASHFGDQFPIVLDGDHPSNSDSSHFGDNFPLIFGDSSYYIGSRFPITFKQ